MNSIITLLKPINDTNLLLPYEQYYIQSLHREGKLIPEQNPEETNPSIQKAINPNPRISHDKTSGDSAFIMIPHHPRRTTP